ncbi:MAG: L,D-transpeptidase/peptidoglycan binding protein [Coriobacteriia bacterium]|nr:L,D-transpeptidase/peptidoglycan binding protein [Coriobacteriia bacterium]
MHRASTPIRALALVAAMLLFFTAGSGALAVADDYLSREVLPTGAEVAGVDVAGLSREAARELVAREVAEPLAEPLEVAYGGRTFTLDAATLITVDVEAMVDAAFEPHALAALPRRVVDRTLDRPSGARADVALAVDEAGVATWIDDVAASIDTEPVDATMTVDVNRLVVVPSEAGETVDRQATAERLRAALFAGEKRVDLAVDLTDPAVTESDLGPAIIVDLSERRLYLYDEGDLFKTYGVAVGTPNHPTPRGDFEITLKRYMPTWSNPGSAWAADMPKTIGPGPSNPLGTRALNINSPGIRIHGTSADYSIGTAASHGCMRMHRWDIEDLYERVEVGTPVYIVR